MLVVVGSIRSATLFSIACSAARLKDKLAWLARQLNAMLTSPSLQATVNLNQITHGTKLAPGSKHHSNSLASSFALVAKMIGRRS